MSWIFTVTLWVNGALLGPMFLSSAYPLYNACESARVVVEQASRVHAHQRPSPEILVLVSPDCVRLTKIPTVPLPKLPKGEESR